MTIIVYYMLDELGTIPDTQELHIFEIESGGGSEGMLKLPSVVCCMSSTSV